MPSLAMHILWQWRWHYPLVLIDMLPICAKGLGMLIVTQD